jgi:hypothetical protein
MKHAVRNLINQSCAEQGGRIALCADQLNMVAPAHHWERRLCELLLEQVSLASIWLQWDVLAAEAQFELKISFARSESMQQNVGNDAIVVVDKSRVQIAQGGKQSLLIRPRSTRFALSAEQADIELNAAAATERSLSMAGRTGDVVEQRS